MFRSVETIIGPQRDHLGCGLLAELNSFGPRLAVSDGCQ